MQLLGNNDNISVYLKADKLIRLPVIPSEISLENSASIDTKTIIKFGEVPVFNGTKLRKINLNSFFPNQQYSFLDFPVLIKPYDYVKRIKAWLNLGLPIRLIITGTDINATFVITDFTYTEKDGTGDVYFDLSLMEYRYILIPKYDLTKNNSSSSSNNNTSNRTNENKTTPKTHKVVKGDTLSAIAKKYYGKGSDYPKIQEKNKKKYPSLAKSTKILIGWVLDL